MSDLFEKNVGDLIRAGALPLDPERTARARTRFLHEDRPGRKVAAAAAALLIAATIVWSARTEPSKPPAVARSPQAVTPVSVPMEGGNEFLRGTLKTPRDPRPGSLVHFEGRSPLPEGLAFVVRVHRLEESLVGGRLARTVTESPSGGIRLQQGAFDYDFPYKRGGVLRLEVTARDAHQDTAVAKQMKISESQREWSFSYRLWDAKLLSRLGPQRIEATDLVAETRELLGRVEAACVSEAEFLARKKALVADADRLRARGQSFAKEGLYPASSNAAAFVARDLATSMEIFKWLEGKFAGPRSYYTDNQRGRDHRQQVFEFATLRDYLDEAAAVAGREFGLWILEEFRRAGPRPELAEAVKPHRTHPGVAPFAERLMGLDGVDLVKLEEELRALK